MIFIRFPLFFACPGLFLKRILMAVQFRPCCGICLSFSSKDYPALISQLPQWSAILARSLFSQCVGQGRSPLIHIYIYGPVFMSLLRNLWCSWIRSISYSLAISHIMAMILGDHDATFTVTIFRPFCVVSSLMILALMFLRGSNFIFFLYMWLL